MMVWSEHFVGLARAKMKGLRPLRKVVLATSCVQFVCVIAVSSIRGKIGLMGDKRHWLADLVYCVL